MQIQLAAKGGVIHPLVCNRGMVLHGKAFSQGISTDTGLDTFKEYA